MIPKNSFRDSNNLDNTKVPPKIAIVHSTDAKTDCS